MNKAYLIVDMSNDFVADEGSLTAGKPAQAIVPNILRTLHAFDEKNDLIVFCMDNHQPNDDHFLLWTPHNVIGTWGAELYGKLNDWFTQHGEQANVRFLPKSEYDAFYQTDLEQILKNNEIDTVRVAGVCTDICVFNTVYGAYKCGFHTEVATDECATFTTNHTIFLNQMNLIYKTDIIQ
jgi:nicotinamidase-related amidase